MDNFFFRTDAALTLGTGHVHRCLALAEELRGRGALCHFISRVETGHLIDVIAQRGFCVTPMALNSPLPASGGGSDCYKGPSNSSTLLESDWEDDARQTLAIMAESERAWLVVDHYALDQRWEAALQPHCRKLLVIDDLADRPHSCDVLLDQNLGRLSRDYVDLVPAGCQMLIGPQYALLRPEFAILRSDSLQRRRGPTFENILVTMGGTDQPNATGKVLETLQGCPLSPDCRITVVMGSQAPWLPQVAELAQRMPWPTKVMVNTADMGRCMAESDLAIGAAGGTAWERCCLGLPSLVVVLADNQWLGAQALYGANACSLIGQVSDIATKLPSALGFLSQGDRLKQMGFAASAVTDGRGVTRVLQALEAIQ